MEWEGNDKEEMRVECALFVKTRLSKQNYIEIIILIAQT